MKKEKSNFNIFYILIVLAIVIVAILVILTVNLVSLKGNKGDKLKIYTTFYPLHEFTKEVTRDLADVTMLGENIDAHHYELGQEDIKKLEDADMLIYSSKDLEHWVEKIENNVNNKDLVLVEASKNIAKEDDPHYWLDPRKAKTYAETISSEIIKVDNPSEEKLDKYNKYLNEFIEQLDDLDKKYDELEKASGKTMLISHPAFGYVAKRYNIKQIGLSGMHDEDELSANKLKEIEDTIKEDNIKYLFIESSEDADHHKALVEDNNLTIKKIYTMEKAEENENYISLMNKNLDSLKSLIDE